MNNRYTAIPFTETYQKLQLQLASPRQGGAEGSKWRKKWYGRLQPLSNFSYQSLSEGKGVHGEGNIVHLGLNLCYKCVVEFILSPHK